MNIEYKDFLTEENYKMLNIEFDKYAEKNGVCCNYKGFNFVAKDEDKIIGLITGHSYYNEVYIADLVVLEEYRKQHIGSKLMKKVEEYYIDKGFDFMNLTTYGFQALGFYQKCGFDIEHVRENKVNPKLTKYYLIKYF